MKPPKFVLEDMDCSVLGNGSVPDFLNPSDTFAPGDYRLPKFTHLARRRQISKKKAKRKLAGRDLNSRNR